MVAGIDTQGGNFTIKNSQIDVDLDSDNKNAGIFPWQLDEVSSR